MVLYPLPWLPELVLKLLHLTFTRSSLYAQQHLQYVVSAGQRFLQSGGLGPKLDTPVSNFLLLFQELDQVFLFQGVFKVIHELSDEKMKNAARDCIADVHFDHIEVTHNILFCFFHILEILRKKSCQRPLPETDLNFVTTKLNTFGFHDAILVIIIIMYQIKGAGFEKGKAEKVKFEFEGVDLADGGPSEH